MITKEEIIEVIKSNQRDRDDVIALHPSRYLDVAEELEIILKNKKKEFAVELLAWCIWTINTESLNIDKKERAIEEAKEAYEEFLKENT